MNFERFSSQGIVRLPSKVDISVGNAGRSIACWQVAQAEIQTTLHVVFSAFQRIICMRIMTRNTEK